MVELRQMDQSELKEWDENVSEKAVVPIKKKRVSLSDKSIRKMLDLIEDGTITRNEAAKQFNVSKQTVFLLHNKFLKSSGLEYTGGRISKEIRTMIIDSIQNGTYTRKEAAKQFNVSYQTVLSLHKRFLKAKSVEYTTRGKFSKETKEMIIDSLKNGSETRKSAAKRFNCSYDLVVKIFNRSNQRKKTTYHYLSDEKKKEIIDSIANGTCTRMTAANKFKLPYSSVSALYRQFPLNELRKINSVERKEEETLREGAEGHLKSFIIENRNYTYQQLKTRLWEEFDLELSLSEIDRVIKSFSFSIERTDKTALPILTMDEISERKLLCNHFLYANNSDRQVIYFGKADFDISMRQMVRGSTSEVSEDKMEIQDYTLMASMTRDELFHYKVVDGPKDNVRLKTYVKELLLMLERKNIVGGLIIIDESIFNEYEEIIKSIEAAGHLSLILTEISRFLNPVENVSLDWANYLRSKIPVNPLELDVAIDSFKETMTKDICAKYCQLAIDNAGRFIDREIVNDVL